MKLALGRGGQWLSLIAAAFFALFMLKGHLAGAPAIDPASEFDAARALSRLERILGDEIPHPVDSEANDETRARLVAEIEAIGYAPEIRDDFSCRAAPRRSAVLCGRVRNVVFRAGPESGAAIMLAAHYDSVAAGPGAADDGAGVAAMLEIAAILKTRRPVKPIVFLITDGEEAGLLGAASFVRKDPLADKIAAVISMEARGASGPAILFETSDPNGRDIRAYAQRVKRPVGNSLATNIYKLLPNDTDVTEFLTLGPDAINLGFIGRLPIYHTPLDIIANLDPKSLAHIGASALASLDGFLRDVDHGDPTVEGRIVFADIFNRAMITAPEMMALFLIFAGLTASLAAFVKIKSAAPVRIFFAPLVAMAGGGLLAFASLAIIDALRPEEHFWYAHPAPARAIVYLAAIVAGIGAMAIVRNTDRARLLAASWLWFALLGVAAFAAAPGSVVFTGVPAGLFVCAAIGSAGAPRLLAPLSLLGLGAVIVLWPPLFHHAETALGPGGAWPFAIVAALLFMLAAPLSPPQAIFPRALPLAAIAALAAAMIAAAAAPAYSPAAPRPLSIQHVAGAGGGAAFFSLSPSGGAAPEEMSALARFDRRAIDGLSGERLAAPAPPHDGRPVGVGVASDAPAAGGRAIRLDLAANGADEIIVAVPDAAALIETTIAGEKTVFEARGEKYIRCSGRSCASFALSAIVGEAKAEWTIIGVRHGLGPESDAMKNARPAWAVPAHGGDQRLVISRISI